MKIPFAAEELTSPLIMTRFIDSLVVVRNGCGRHRECSLPEIVLTVATNHSVQCLLLQEC